MIILYFMKKIVAAILFCLMLINSTEISAQLKKSDPLQRACQMSTFHKYETSNALPTSTLNDNFPGSPLSPMYSVPGADKLPISSYYDVGTNSRSMHNLVVDPENPLRLHFISMVTTSQSPSDTVAGAYPSRRVQYTYSADGGVTWKAPVVVGNVRLGFPSIILYKRDGNYVPIIAAHNGPNTGQTNWTTHVYIEQGAPGDGNFKLYAANRTASDGLTKDIGYPSLGLSLNQDTLYVLGCVLQATSSAPAQNLEFGAYSLDAGHGASWLGWLNQPGGSDNQSSLCTGGADLLRVSPTGKIGILWVQGDNSDKGLYYNESVDGGKTWPSTYNELYVPDQSGPGGLLADYDGFDFFYDRTSNPHFIWQADYQVLGANTFYPYTGMVCYWAMGDNSVKILNVNAAIAPAFTTLTINGVDMNVDIVNQSSYFTPPPTGTDIEPTGIAFISKVSTAVSANPKYFRVYYSTFQDGDTMVVDQLGDQSVMKTYLFRSIYFQETTDGGSSWSDPAPFIANDPNAATENKLDYHLPCGALVNYGTAGSTTFHVNFAVDSFPGEQFGFGQAGWTINTWYHKSEVKSKVNGNIADMSNVLAQNFPNPFAASTSIPVTMKNEDNVTISVSDILGREVAIIYHGRLSAGEHRVPFNAPNLGDGIYTYTLKTADGSVSRTMSLVK